MVELPKEILRNPTVDAIYAKYEKNNGEWRRPHLGASQIGNDCDRALWYSFRWCTAPDFGGRMIRLFESGYIQEKRLITDLKDIGVVVHHVHPNTGRQIQYSEFGGHFAGSLDAIAQGFPEAPKTWHVVECKSSNTKNFTKLKKVGVKEAHPVHYAQVQIYMGWSKLDRAYYISVCKDTDEIYGERVYLDKDFIQQIKKKAENIIFRETPPPRIGTPDQFCCRWCDHAEICHGITLPLVSCRTCAHVTPCNDGTWNCVCDATDLDMSQQMMACEQHIFIPKLVPMEPTDATISTVTYGDVTNGPGFVPSKEMWKWVRE